MFLKQKYTWKMLNEKHFAYEYYYKYKGERFKITIMSIIKEVSGDTVSMKQKKIAIKERRKRARNSS